MSQTFVDSKRRARCIVDEHNQHAARASVLEPSMRAAPRLRKGQAIDLDRLPEPRTPFRRLKHSADTSVLRLPKLLADLKLADCLGRNSDVLQFQKFLRRERRTEILILFLQKTHDLPRPVRQAVVRSLTALTRHQTPRSTLLPGTDQTLELADTNTKTAGALPLAQTLLHGLTNHVRSLEFHNTHRQKPRDHAPLHDESAR